LAGSRNPVSGGLTRRPSKHVLMFRVSRGPQCMYVCMRIYVRAAAYSLNCYIGAMVSRRLYRTFQSLVVHRTASETSMGREVSVAMSFTDRVGPECEKLRCP